MFNVFLFFICLIIYIHIYLHFKINPLNELNILTEYSKQEISNTCYYKLPFKLDGNSFLSTLDLNKCTKHLNYYIKEYTSTPLLEPYVKFFTKNKIYKLKNNKYIDLHKNLECRNFYIVHKGTVTILCIHPKYSEHFNLITKNTQDFIDNHTDIIKVELKEKEIVFIPNYWHVSVKSNHKNTIIEKLQYSTILNNFTIFTHNFFTKHKIL